MDLGGSRALWFADRRGSGFGNILEEEFYVLFMSAVFNPGHLEVGVCTNFAIL